MKVVFIIIPDIPLNGAAVSCINTGTFKGEIIPVYSIGLFIIKDKTASTIIKRGFQEDISTASKY
ncbi:hypothetical protein ECO9534_11573 [Escherichia coli O111:H11 str. CVM9534]|nr:hypothetical protein ECO9534_11573 [Escherichia coli O111:H11 str. CVM9534]